MAEAHSESSEPEPAAPAAAVSDQRPRPKGALPRGVQMWLMMGLAAVLLGIILLTGNTAPRDRARGEGVSRSPVPIDTERVAAYQAQLRQRQQELARESEHAPVAPPSALHGASGGEASGATRDALDEARRRKEYESLFASSVAFSRGSAPTGSAERAASATRLAKESKGEADPFATLDAEARQSLQRLNVAVEQLRNANTAAANPSVVTESKPATSTARTDTPASRPTTTSAIIAGAGSHRILEGTVIDAELMRDLDGEFGGPVLCLVTRDVWSYNRDAVVIPAGSTIVGAAKAVDATGQQRIPIAFHRIKFPDGSSYAFEQLTGLDEAGATGLRGKPDHHFWAGLGAAAAMGVITGVSQGIATGAAVGGNGDRTVVIAGGGTEAAGQAASQAFSREANRLPTLPIQKGRAIEIYVGRDLELPAYHDGRTTDNGTRR